MKLPAKLRTFFFSLFLTLFHVFTSSLSYATGGAVVDGGGGDLCEDRFKTVAKDLKLWIESGGPAGLNLNGSNLNGITVDIYKQKMLEKILNSRITCVSPGDHGHPVSVNGRAKECKNFVDPQGFNRIICDRAKFYSEKKDPDNDASQYVIVHHEYASLAGIESPIEDDSSYVLSNQLTGFLQDRVVKKLVVRNQKTPSPQIPSVASCNLSGLKSLFIEKIKDALTAAYAIEGQVFDRSSLVAKVGKPISFCSRMARDINFRERGCGEYGKVENLEITFLSPNRTKLKLLTADTLYGDKDDGDKNSIFRDPGVGFAFEVKTIRDQDGNIVGKQCHANAGWSSMVSSEHGKLVVMNSNGHVADVTKLLVTQIPGSNPSIAPVQLIYTIANLK